jgi:hypothetical protein
MTVSKTPSLVVTSPAPLGGVIYSSGTTTTFTGQANVSLGYPTTGINAIYIKSVGYKVGSGIWHSAIITPAQSHLLWSVVAALSVGLNTVRFNTTDTNGNTVLSSSYTVLVDTSAPVIHFTTPANGIINATSSPLTATIVETEGDLNATSVTVWYNGTQLTPSAVTVFPANNLGTNTTYTVTAALPSGHWNVQVQAMDLAGNTATAVQEFVTVVVATDMSFVVTGTPSQVTIAGFPATQATIKSNLPAAMTVLVTATATDAHGVQQNSFPTSTQSINPGSSVSVDLVFAGLAPGTYTVTITVYSTLNVPLSVPTTTTLTVA